MWVDQWPLPLQKLVVMEEIVQGLLLQGQIRPSTSPYNSPAFVIKKRGGKGRWRLLVDLRAINRIMLPMGKLQPGLPSPTAIPAGWPLAVVDIKDCFFSIPLHPKDTPKFAFSLPSTNVSRPHRRFEFKVLPQGMANSPTLCQRHVDGVLEPVRRDHPSALLLHYMDDILVAAPTQQLLDPCLRDVRRTLHRAGLFLDPEKVQLTVPAKYLGSVVGETSVRRPFPVLQEARCKTLNDFQKLVGSVQWVRSYLPIPPGDMQPLYDLLRGPTDLKSPRAWTPAARDALHRIIARATSALTRYEPNKTVYFRPLQDGLLPWGALYQAHGVIEWIYVSGAASSLEGRLDALARLVIAARRRCLALLGCVPTLDAPYLVPVLPELMQASWAWAVTLLDVPVGGGPLPKLLETIPLFPISLAPSPVSPQPVQGPQIFTDASKDHRVALYIPHLQQCLRLRSPYPSVQPSELWAILQALQLFPDTPINVISDSKYAVELVSGLPDSFISPGVPLHPLFSQVQQALQTRSARVYLLHVHSHRTTAGPIYSGNAVVDAALRSPPETFLAVADEVSEDPAQLAHSRWHLSARSLRHLYGISRQQARDIVKACASCAPFQPRIPERARNPRGDSSNALWQMDMTHIGSRVLHVSVDTFSGFVSASFQPGETARCVIAHLYQAFAHIGVPTEIKTDNGPAYVAKAFEDFCREFGILHTTGIAYNPQGQAVVERTNRSLKDCFTKMFGKLPRRPSTPDLARVLFALNFLSVRADGTTPAARFYAGLVGHSDPTSILPPPVRAREGSSVLWRDPQGQWHGPSRVVARRRGCLAVQGPQAGDGPFWVPLRQVRDVLVRTDPSDSEEVEQP